MQGDLPLGDALAFRRELLARARVDLRELGIKWSGELFAKEQALLQIDAIPFPPRRPPEVIVRIRPSHVGQEDRDG